MGRALKRRGAVAVLSVAALAAAVPALLAAPAQAATDTGAVHCDLRVGKPHWSASAQSIVYRTHVECTGPVAQVTVIVHGSLGFVLGGSPARPAAGAPSAHDTVTSDETRTIPTGVSETFLTPADASRTLWQTGTYWAASTVRVGDGPLTGAAHDPVYIEGRY